MSFFTATKRVVEGSVASALLCGFAPMALSQESAHSISGPWVGGIETDDKWQFITATFAANKDTAGRISVPLEGINASFSSVRIVGSQVISELGSGTAKLVFKGVLSRDMIDGVVEGPGRMGRFQLMRVADVAPATLAAYVGAYRFRDGHELVIDAMPDTPNSLMVTDVATGEVRAFFPVSDTQFASGPMMFVPFPTEQTLVFHRTGALVSGLERTWGVSRVETATRVHLRQEEIHFSDGDVALAGTLLLPEGHGPYPAVVFTHGGGPALREWFWGLGYLFAARGVAVLAYDKRGAGGSKGNWREASFPDLADDAVAAARFLQARAEIEKKKVGFWGISQGGWIAPLAATRFEDAAFVIALSGGGLSPAEQELFDTEYELQSSGMSESEVREALNFQALRNSIALSPESWNQYETALNQARGKRWFRFPGTDTWGPATRDDPYWTSIRRFYFYDPAPTLRRLKPPILALFGAMDSPRGAAANEAAMTSILQAAGHRDFTVRLIPRGRHNLMEVPIDNPREFARLKRFVPGLFDQIVEWTSERVEAR